MSLSVVLLIAAIIVAGLAGLGVRALSRQRAYLEQNGVPLDAEITNLDTGTIRGVILNSGRTPALCITSSANKPAALITQRQVKSPRFVRTPITLSLSIMKSTNAVSRRIFTPFSTAFSAAVRAS